MTPLRDIPGYLKVFRIYIGRRMYLIFLLNLASALSEGIGIVMLLPLLETMGPGGEADSGAARVVGDVLAAMGLGGSMIGILGLIGVAFLVKGVIGFGTRAYTGYLQAQLMRELKARMFDAYSRMDYLYYAHRDTGHFINIINTQINNFYGSFVEFIGLFSSAITTLTYFGFALFVAWRFGLMALIIGIVMLLLFQRLNIRVRELSRRAARENGQLAKLLIQSLQAFKYLTATDRIGRLRSGAMASIRRLTGYQVRQSVASAFTAAIVEPFSVFFIILILIVQVVVLHQPLAPMMVSILLFHRGIGAVLTIQNRWQATLNMIGSVEMVRDEFITQRENREPDGDKDLPPLSNGIVFQGVDFAYGRDLGNVLSDISLDIRARTTVALVGESGAGKSTIVDLLSLLLRPGQGKVLIDGVPGDQVRLASWRRQIGYVSQETVIFDDTLANNICLWEGDMDADPELHERIRDAARRAHIAHFIEALPSGYNTFVGDRGIRLSGGQRQRLFIARELFKQPNLLILDEATSALDTESERYIQQSIDALKGRMTVVIIAHRLSTIRNVDYVYVLDHGRLVEEGPYRQLRDLEASRFGKMVAMQAL
uniref:ATP-binding cassette, subfamily B, MsbA n=1 Tax=Candidatus Kentrum sp. FM TaxID=2126340 RepID=A0A450TEI5_9GAMM|nr:MAG: ATP-binding cassette, subfamily B, MsbA [Candidatus Kentron sp. FM]VFJ65397.1 MAG: ATP-binding cassette, subfamily B, MsbA [Candidatus Kentron sp. FM]VFK08580.1 MAG: ATP-binding cassette, subfamily B, MsbA [Candidatus Kentron sp. FM]